VLYRDTYRGEIVWNRTRKRNAWGQVKAHARPTADIMRVSAPELRSVSDELWDAAHARLEATRATYLRTNGGRLWGRPTSGLASKYLLTGIARCGVCGAGLEVRTRKGRPRTAYYSCSSFYRRGVTVCPNRYEIPMALADSEVLTTLLDELLTPARFRFQATGTVTKLIGGTVPGFANDSGLQAVASPRGSDQVWPDLAGLVRCAA
jgi:site-specific DNA recombinase